jgi:hypothetical protein
VSDDFKPICTSCDYYNGRLCPTHAAPTDKVTVTDIHETPLGCGKCGAAIESNVYVRMNDKYVHRECYTEGLRGERDVAVRERDEAIAERDRLKKFTDVVRLDTMWQGMVLELDAAKRERDAQKSRADAAERRLEQLEAALKQIEASDDGFTADGKLVDEIALAALTSPRQNAFTRAKSEDAITTIDDSSSNRDKESK